MAKRSFGDRYDGKKIRNADPFFFVMPHIMKDRCDAQVFFETKVDTTQVDKLLQKLRQEQDLPVKFLHILLTAFVRTLAAKPVLNRFVRGGKIFARDGITLSLTIKKKMCERGDEGVVKVRFDPKDTLFDVMDRFQKAVDECMAEEDSQNDTDAFVKVLRSLPSFVIRFVVWSVTKLDNMGLMPKFIHNLSPFHTSAFLTDLGSLRIDPVSSPNLTLVSGISVRALSSVSLASDTACSREIFAALPVCITIMSAPRASDAFMLFCI